MLALRGVNCGGNDYLVGDELIYNELVHHST